ncbi:MAG: hypothetical protein AAFM92_16840, partial [Pseudomonadota bacterium]
KKGARDKHTGFVHTLPHSLSLYLSLKLSLSSASIYVSCLHLLSGNNNHDYFQFTIDLCHSADADKTQKLMQKTETA